MHMGSNSDHGWSVLFLR